MSAVPAEVNEALEAAVASWKRDDAPGFSVALRSAEGWIWRRGVGLACVQLGLANTPRTRMRIGSITKQFVCVVVFMLAREGRIDLGASVREFFQELPEAFEPVTLRHLMNHTSGIWCHFSADTLINGRASLWGGNSTYPPLSDDEVFGMVCSQTELAFPPGERFSYSNGSYVLLTRLIERVEGAPLEAVFRDRLFIPLGMLATGLTRSDATLEPGMATLHVPTAGGYRRGVFPVCMGGEGGAVSTADDMLRWLAELNHPEMLSQEVVDALDEPVRLNNGHIQTFRYGMIRDRHRGLDILYHDGGVVGGGARAARIPEIGLDIVILLNRGDVVPTELSNRLVDAVLGSGAEARPPAQPALGFEGRYYAPGQARTFEFKTLEDRTVVQAAGMTAPLIEDGDAALCNTPASPDIRFRRIAGPEGETIELEDCGARATLRPLPDLSQAEDTAEELVGGYQGHNMSAEATVTQKNGATGLTIQGPYGIQKFRLEPLARDLWQAHPLGSAVNRPLVEAVRRDGAIVGLAVAGFRVKLVFTRDVAA